MKKILLGIFFTSFLAYGSDPLAVKRLEPNIKQCYKQSPETYNKANNLFSSAVRVGIFGEYGKTWENFVALINSTDEFRTALLTNCDKEIRDAILNMDANDTMKFLLDFVDYAIGL